MTPGHASALACVVAALLALAGCRRGDEGTPGPVAGPSTGYATTQAGSAGPGPGPGPPPSGADDRDFIFAAATDGLFELQVSQLATARAATPEVRNLATMMVNDHTNANAELAQLASVRGIALPTQLPQELQAQLRKLAQASGTGFDREYVRQVGIVAHEKNIRRFEQAGREGGDPQLKAWIDRTLPMLRQHLSEAQKLDRKA